MIGLSSRGLIFSVEDFDLRLSPRRRSPLQLPPPYPDWDPFRFQGCWSLLKQSEIQFLIINNGWLFKIIIMHLYPNVKIRQIHQIVPGFVVYYLNDLLRIPVSVQTPEIPWYSNHSIFRTMNLPVVARFLLIQIFSPRMVILIFEGIPFKVYRFHSMRFWGSAFSHSYSVQDFHTGLDFVRIFSEYLFRFKWKFVWLCWNSTTRHNEKWQRIKTMFVFYGTHGLLR